MYYLGTRQAQILAELDRQILAFEGGGGLDHCRDGGDSAGSSANK
jgi:hypothetical protein